MKQAFLCAKEMLGCDPYDRGLPWPGGPPVSVTKSKSKMKQIVKMAEEVSEQVASATTSDDHDKKDNKRNETRPRVYNLRSRSKASRKESVAILL